MHEARAMPALEEELGASVTNEQWEAAWRTYQPQIRAALARYYRITDAMWDAEDWDQLGRESCWEALATYNSCGSYSLGLWIWVITHRRARDMAKRLLRQKRRPPMALYSLDWDPHLGISDALKAGPIRSDPEMRLVMRDQQLRWQCWVRATLTPIEREALMCAMRGTHHWYATAAETTGFSVKTLDNALQRARRKLLRDRELLLDRDAHREWISTWGFVPREFLTWWSSTNPVIQPVLRHLLARIPHDRMRLQHPDWSRRFIRQVASRIPSAWQTESFRPLLSSTGLQCLGCGNLGSADGPRGIR
ncbi:MAG: hypothetical protein C7B46_14920 [Sulfobacillus benefaciens]|uniref:Uncharacterized protein n=1 Tax=Sulfobacillus benefaciens TaxID=453960 RepID=A0A2T2XCR8_9FIRM|nr:MAG: hypothetical protein C7B46_14920 [Sulfobacillus benefaciens]